jgi:hypothetical protein
VGLSKLDTDHAFTATWPSGSCPEPDLKKEITGGCVHHIWGENVVGTIRSYDVMPVVGEGALLL